MRSLRLLFTLQILLAASLFAGIFWFMPQLVQAQQKDSKLQINDLSVGDGAQAVNHANVQVHYTGWLMSGEKFDSSLDRNQPFNFTPGLGQVIQGWEKGVLGMKVGGKRELIIPPEMGYGERGAGAAIPPNATLRFEIELLDVTPPKYSRLDSDAVKENLERGVKIIDIRRQDEWKKTGIIENAILVTAFDADGQPRRSFVSELAEQVKPDEEVIVIDDNGERSTVVAYALSEHLDYQKVHMAEKGIDGWLASGNKLVAKE